MFKERLCASLSEDGWLAGWLDSHGWPRIAMMAVYSHGWMDRSIDHPGWGVVTDGRTDGGSEGWMLESFLR